MLLLSTLLWAAQGADASAVLAAAERALGTRPPLTYEANLARTQVLSWTSHLAAGTVSLAANGDFRVDATIKVLRSEEPERRVSLVRRGEEFAFLDHDKRRIIRGDVPVVGGLASRLAHDLAQLLPVPPAELTDAAVGPRTTVGSKAAVPVTGTSAGGILRHTWHLDLTDHLPLLWETELDLGAGETLRKRLTVRELRGQAYAPQALPEDYAEAEAVVWDDPEDRERGRDGNRYTSLVDTIEPFRAHFNAEKAHLRAVGLFAPT